MPDIINNVTNNLYPASGHNIYVCELAPYNATNLYIQQLKSFGGYRIAKNSSGSRSYLWDLYLLSANMSARTTHPSGNFFYKRFSYTDYKPLYCSSFSDNAGTNIYSPITNFSGLSVLNHPKFNEYKYTGNFSFSPIISTRINQQLAAENIIYRASFFPLYPLMVCSSIPTHKSFGPAFMSNFDIRVDGMGQLGDVEIDCSLIGGRSVISPENVLTYRPSTANQYLKIKSLNSTDNQFITDESNNFTDQYRAINLSDCAFYPALFTGANAFRNFGYAVQNSYNSNIMPRYKIVGMSLKIQQQVDLTFTYPGYSVSTQIIDFYDVAGPRFASLANRTVSGSIKLFSPQNYSFITTNASSLTLYFGSVFFYSMKNVDWQQPIVTINPGNGYFIEYNFTCRLTEFTAFSGLNNSRVSEFL